MSLNEFQIERYSRNMILKEIGGKGQRKLLESKVLIIGAGGLGSPAALYLAAAGIGVIGIADGDKVELSNLQRQIIHFTSDVGRGKVFSAREKIKALNPDVKVETHSFLVNRSNIRELIKDYDFIIDGTDNLSSKFLINDACVLSQKPFSHGAILRFFGQTMTYVPGKPCYRCLIPKPPESRIIPNCSQAGVLGAVPGILGTIQAAEAIKYLLGMGNLLTGKLLYINILHMDFNLVTIKRNTECAICGEHPGIMELKEEREITCNLR